MSIITSLTNKFQGLAGVLSGKRTVEMSRESLAKILYPLMAFKGDEYSSTNETLQLRLRELSDWVRIGFHNDEPKGTLYEDLQKALTHLISQVAKTEDGSPTIPVEKKFMDFIKEGTCQINGAAIYLESSAKMQGKYQEIPDRHGNILAVPLIQIYNRPYESHQMAAYKLNEVAEHFKNHFDGKPINVAALNLVP